ncbi:MULTISPECIES: hypothetical protein [unclassified Streptomyces]|uniref:hypothetical protein n=1 Tax=unclassified Streptomyces TaxID=2593676 RepID=UPI000A3E34BA|nr:MULTISPECIES: hypothetical protein [unclassified Streptomyces]
MAVTVRKASLLPAGTSLTARGLPEPSVRCPCRYLYAPDPAVVHAGLVAEVAEDVAGGLLDGGGVRPRTGAPGAAGPPRRGVEFVVAAADGTTTALAVPVRFPQAL